MSRRWLGLGAIGLSCGALAAAACSGDDNVNNGSPVTSEAGPDSTTGGDAAEDSSTSDSTTGDNRSPTEGGPDASDGGADATSGMCSVFDASALDEASVAAGFAQVWQVYRCYACHQGSSQTVSDAGVGIVLSGNNAGIGTTGTIFPPNLTDDPATGLGCWSDPQIENAILLGIDNEGGALCSPMPKFGLALTTADGGPKLGYPMDAGTAQEIVDYLRSLPVVVNQVSDTTCSTDGGSDAGADAAHDGSADASEQ